MENSADSVLSFWFEEIPPEQWWLKSPELDDVITKRFGDLHRSATACELFLWRDTARGKLAEILILDQFSRNIYRGKVAAFSSDSLALALAQTAIATNADCELNVKERFFLYLPFMHSESPLIHSKAVALFNTPGLESGLEFELKHKAIIDRFGRFPHRNTLMARTSTPQEQQFLETPDSFF